MNINNVQIEKISNLPRRKGIENKLEELLTSLPIKISGRKKLRAYVGLGRIIYIESIKPHLNKKDIEIMEGIKLERDYNSKDDLYFSYKNQRYLIRCRE